MSWIRWWIWAIFERIERQSIYQRLNFPMDFLNYFNFPRFIPRIHGHGWRNQPRIKYIYFTVSTKTSPSLSPYIHIHFIWLLLHDSHLILNHYVVPTFSGFRPHMSTESYSGVTLPSVPPIHNKWLLHGLYIIQISNINFIGMIRVLFYLKIWDKLLGRR